MKLVEDFIRVLCAAADGRSRVEIDLLWRVFLEWKPELAASPTKRAELERLLTEAANTGKIALPKGRKLYDRTALPSLPLWVAFPVQKDMTERFDHKSYPWSAPMSFVAGLPRIPSPEDALALNRFFVGLKDAPLVPAKERSYGIFGDEKRLSSVLTGVLAAGLTYETLRCFEPMLVPVHRVFPSREARILIVENEAAFDSFCRWNQGPLWASIIFGRGIEVWKSVEFLCSTWSAEVRFDYFGDFDQEGVCIAFQLHRKLEKKGRALLPLKPAYRALPFHTPGTETKTHTSNWREAIHWLDDSGLIQTATTLFALNKRVAQEAFGWESLMHLKADCFRIPDASS